ncbi:GNAT family N-acetyltransferase [Rhizobium leguminosarum bv. viciae]|uniref:GNAT family N-acetyltransferase n=1 Tax=Rhizobium leguminosarum TaxID=384 RepID=UPI001442808A|nr:GNAT family N-acetyltransferase [Rhizobium leguminosarum]NKJ94692.1 GNAT family N-acetyltransferase [Rhizobium leguminosarum bv. viciae]
MIQSNMPVVRAATMDDTPQLGRFGTLLMAMHNAWDPVRFIPTGSGTPDKYARFLAERITCPETVLFVAEKDNKVAGYVYGEVEGPDYMALRGPAGVIHDIFVDQSERNGGIGTALLDAAMSALAKLGAPQLVLETAAKNETAQRLFTRAGFRQTMLEMSRSFSKPSLAIGYEPGPGSVTRSF